MDVRTRPAELACVPSCSMLCFLSYLAQTLPTQVQLCSAQPLVGRTARAIRAFLDLATESTAHGGFYHRFVTCRSVSSELGKMNRSFGRFSRDTSVAESFPPTVPRAQHISEALPTVQRFSV